MDEETVARTPLVRPAPPLAHEINLGVNAERRIVHIAGELEDGDDERLMTVMDHLWGQPLVTPITVYLNTPGGDVGAMFAIHDVIRMSPVPVQIIGYGQVVSAGVLLLACGHHRRVTESCVLMAHEFQMGGDSEGIGLRSAKDRRKWEDWQYAHWCELMGRYTPQDAAWWKSKTYSGREYWLLGGKEIVEAGLADEVIAK